MLEKGTKEDKYDFLELYIRNWKKEEARVKENCNVTGDASDVDDDDQEEGDRDLTKDGLTFPLHEPRFKGDKSRPEFISKPYYKREWHPYDWYVHANTEYYFNYKGSMPEPPCFEGVHWRVLRHPVRISPGQLNKLQKMMGKDRLNPETCRYETAGKKLSGSEKYLFNRPIQTTSRRHKLVYCDCDNWKSKSEMDQFYCDNRNLDE